MTRSTVIRNPQINGMALGAAGLALFVVLARAWVQSATIDECDSYLQFASPLLPSHWYASSGNHVLNTIIVRLFTSIFGLSHLTLRSGAIAGALIFIFAMYRLSWIFGRSTLTRLLIFVCLTFNPFILDYLVASRGYSLALGLLMAAVTLHTEELLFARGLVEPAIRLERLVMASVCLGLSFTANFSFFYIIVSTATAFLLTARLWLYATWRQLLLTYVLPAAAAVFIIAGSTLLEFPRSQIYFGAATFRQMWQSLMAPSLSELNPEVVNPLIFHALQVCYPALPWIFCLSLVLSIGGGLTGAGAAEEEKERRVVCLYLTGAVGGALALSAAAHWSLRIPLPQERTGLFFVPLSTLLVALFVGFPRSGRIGSAIRGLAVATMGVGCVYFLGCLRLSYFQEWKFEAETRPAFNAVRELARQRNIHDIVLSWEYSGAFRFYDLYYGATKDTTFIDMQQQQPAQDSLYVLNETIDHLFLSQHKCEIPYRGDFSGIVAAICSSESAVSTSGQK